MRTLIAGLIVAGLGLGSAAGVSAATSSSELLISVQAIDALEVTGGGALKLGGADLLTGAPDRQARLRYSHNDRSPKSITAQIAGAPAGQDISLTVSIDGGAGPRTLLRDGVPMPAQVVYGDIPAGALADQAITYEARATRARTRDGNYQLTITYTSLDAAG